MEKVRKLDANLGGYFELSFIMTQMGNLDVKLEQLLYVSFTMIEVDKFLIKQNRFNGYYR